MTLEELIAKAKEDPAFRKQVAVWATSTDEGKEIMENFSKVEFEKNVKEVVAKIHTDYENDIFEALGERKKGDEKAYEFNKKFLTELKELRGKSGDDKDTVIKELKQKLKEAEDGGEINGHWKKIHEEALAKWEAKEAEYKTTIETKENEFSTTQIRSQIASARAGIKLKDGIPEEAVEALFKVNEDKILKHAKLVDGKVVFHKEDGTPWMNAEFKPVNATEVMKEVFGTMISDGTNSGGTGGAGGGAPTKLKGGEIVTTGEGENAKKKLVLDKSTFSTKVEFNKQAEKTLRAQGVSASDKEYNELLMGAYEEYGVSELDLQ